MKKILLLVAIWLFCGINTVWAEIGTHMHVAVFFVDKAAYNDTFPNEIKGNDIEGPLRGKAELMTFIHSANVLDADVLNLQNDTLRFNAANQMEDFGINCSLTLHTDGGWSIAGLCKVFLSGKDKTKNNIIKKVSVPSSLVWYQIFEDKTNHVIAYVMKEEGQNL